MSTFVRRLIIGWSSHLVVTCGGLVVWLWSRVAVGGLRICVAVVVCCLWFRDRCGRWICVAVVVCVWFAVGGLRTSALRSWSVGDTVGLVVVRCSRGLDGRRVCVSGLFVIVIYHVSTSLFVICISAVLRGAGVAIHQNASKGKTLFFLSCYNKKKSSCWLVQFRWSIPLVRVLRWIHPWSYLKTPLRSCAWYNLHSTVSGLRQSVARVRISGGDSASKAVELAPTHVEVRRRL